MRSVCSEWLRSEAEDFQSRASFEDALFSGKFLQYSWYRLKYFFLLQGVQLLVHLTEFFFLYWVVEDHSFRSIALILSALYLIQSGWWGGLERLRDAIRQLRFHGLLYRAPRIVQRWHLAAECIISLLLIVTFILSLSYFFTERRTFISAVLLMYGVRVACGMYLSTLQAPTYAIKRTYFPIGALATVEFVGLLLFLASWYVVGIWGMVVSHVLVTFVQAFIRFKYIRYTYQGLKWKFPSVILWRSPRSRLRNLARVLDRDFFIQFFSAGMMSTDTLIVFSFFIAASRVELYHSLFMLFFLISPLIRASHSWIRLFYFDLKKVDLNLYKIYKEHAEKQIGNLAICLALFFATVASVCLLFTHSPEPQFLLFLYVFFVVHSLFSYLQMKFFCSHMHVLVISSSIVLMILCVLVPELELGGFHPVLLLSGCFVFTWLSFRITAGRKTVASETLKTLPYPHWLSSALTAKEDALVLHYRVENKAPNSFTNQMPKLLTRLESRGISATCFRRNSILILLSRAEEEFVLETLQRHSYGFLKAPETIMLPGEGMENLKQLDRHRVVPEGFLASFLATRCTPANIADSSEDLKKIFKAMFPDGDIYEVSSYARGDSSSKSDLLCPRHTSVLSRAMIYAQLFESFHHRTQEFISAFCPQGEMAVIFCLKKKKRGRKRWETWENILLGHTLSLALPSPIASNPDQL